MEKAVKLLGPTHAGLMVHMANEQDRLENKWIARAGELHSVIIDSITHAIKTQGKPDVDLGPIIEFVFIHYFDAAGVAAIGAEYEHEFVIKGNRLAKPRMPKSFRDLQSMYDRYRRTKKLPPGLKKIATDIKRDYLKKTKEIWRTHSEAFREGDDATQENVLREIQEAAGGAESRAKTIVRTETTNYYNQTRRKIYDQSDAVTHYLFLAIRDQATTKWCTDKVVDGKRGRHGLVYKKGDPLTAQETPACHWNCRSEMVPLTPYNPRHLQLIEDEELQRRNNKCAPLPKGWRSNG